MSLLGDIKEIGQVLQKAGNIELYGKLLNLQGDALELQEQVDQLKKDNQGLKDQLELKAKMTFKTPYYFQEGDEVPFCPRCWEKDGRAIHMTRRGPFPECPSCLLSKPQAWNRA